MHSNSIRTLSAIVKKCRKVGFICPPELSLRSFLQNRQHVQVILDYRCFDYHDETTYVPSLSLIDNETLEQLTHTGALITGLEEYVWQAYLGEPH